MYSCMVHRDANFPEMKLKPYPSYFRSSQNSYNDSLWEGYFIPKGEFNTDLYEQNSKITEV